MPLLDRGGARIHYDVQGEPSERPPLLLSHGFSASSRMWERNVGALAADREVITWDMRGHARSDSPADPSRYGVEQSVEDMLALLDVLGGAARGARRDVARRLPVARLPSRATPSAWRR